MNDKSLHEAFLGRKIELEQELQSGKVELDAINEALMALDQAAPPRKASRNQRPHKKHMRGAGELIKGMVFDITRSNESDAIFSNTIMEHAKRHGIKVKEGTVISTMRKLTRDGVLRKLPGRSGYKVRHI